MSELLRVRHLKKHFQIRKGFLTAGQVWVKAVDDVSFGIHRGETLGLVGESGSGKSTVARLILKLLTPTSGQVHLDGQEVSTAVGQEMKDLRRKMGIVFQDPAASMNPRASIRWSLNRVMRVHGFPARKRDEIVAESLKAVNLGPEMLDRFPHQLSGGQQQRISVARAMLLRPQLLILDEPTSALDISVQAQVLNVLLDLQTEMDLAFLFISHDLHVVRYVSDRIAIMYLGRILEIGPSEEVFRNALHPYTRGLASSSPPLSPHDRGRRRLLLKDQPPSLIDLPTGCRLHPRCPFCQDQCVDMQPELREITPGHFAACHRAEEI